MSTLSDAHPPQAKSELADAGKVYSPSRIVVLVWLAFLLLVPVLVFERRCERPFHSAG